MLQRDMEARSAQVIEIPAEDYNLVIRTTQQKQMKDKIDFLKTVPCFGVSFTPTPHQSRPLTVFTGGV